MLYGKVLRAPKYRAKLKSVDLAPAKTMDGIIAVQDGDFVGSRWAFGVRGRPGDRSGRQNGELGRRRRCRRARSCPNICARMRMAACRENPFADEIDNAKKSLKATYTIAYVQHAPLEPRTAVAEWADGKLTVWTATQNPFGVRGELAQAFRLADDAVRVIVPDFGSGYGGKHTGESAIEAARIAQGREEAGDAAMDARGRVHVALTSGRRR